jgi:radical SAM superfamily enzyme YgiQ (UPF0313 family)
MESERPPRLSEETICWPIGETGSAAEAQDWSATPLGPREHWPEALKTAAGIVRNANRHDLVDVETLPFHDREIYNKYGFFRHSHYLRVMAGRGCPFHCSFCTNPVLMDHFGGKRYIRKRSPGSMIAEIEHTIARHPHTVKFLFFIDEVLWVKNDWLREFFQLYKERIRLPFTGNFRFGAIQEEDVKLLADAGATGLIFATETGDEAQRRGFVRGVGGGQAAQGGAHDGCLRGMRILRF